MAAQARSVSVHLPALLKRARAGSLAREGSSSLYSPPFEIFSARTRGVILAGIADFNYFSAQNPSIRGFYVGGL